MTDIAFGPNKTLESLRLRDAARRLDAPGRLVVVPATDPKSPGCYVCRDPETVVAYRLHIGQVNFSEELLADPLIAATGTWTKIVVDVCAQCVDDLAASIAKQNPTKESR